MKRVAVAIVASVPLVANAEVLDKEPSVAFLIAAAAAAGLFSYCCARHLARKFAVLGLIPAFVFFPALSEQLDPSIRAALISEGGMLYIFFVWLGPASLGVAFALGLYRRGRPSGHPIPPILIAAAASVLGGLGLSKLSGLSAPWACTIAAGALLVNGIVAAVEDSNE